MKNFGIAGFAALAMVAAASPAFARDQSVNLGEIAPGQGSTAQFIHLKRGTTNTSTTEVYAGPAKVFTDTVLFDITKDGEGSGVFTVQFSSLNGKTLKNITNGTLTLMNLTTGASLYTKAALTSGSQFLIPFVTGSYRASVSGNAAGSNGGDYQITFAAPVPEPAVVGSMAAGLLLAGAMATRRRRKMAKAA